ncbi:hypothetical protein E1B28_009795 [Marasmius oreades]|uniref:Ricin B lectin domain-containing protein n=1 Tax=Marasmius oreades TaxID=181124 RepID=A0A9P7RVS8_9AGAR|nr:uncharacterized protein E1B28_009795 [Marasmius oreades]KAG7090701.1 hypothetical protein E1B28_009795 [Marasmius oreades]
MRFTAVFTLRFLALVAAVAGFQVQSNNPAFNATGRQGCITALSNSNGVPVVIHDCNSDDSPSRDWDFSRFTRQNSGPQPLKIFGDKCLDVKDGNNADGTKLQIWTCVNGNTNQLWISVTDFTFQWAGTNKCIDLTDGNINDGNQLQIWTCDSNNLNQKWTANPIVTQPPPQSAGVQLVASGGPGRPPMCMTAAFNSDGSNVAIAACFDPTATFPAGNITWVIPSPGSTGQIKTFDGTKCLDVRNGDTSNGNLLQVWTCVEGNTNQLWRLDGSDVRSISWAGQNKCVDVPGRNYTAGNVLQISDCDLMNNLGQWWDVQNPTSPL